MRLPSFADNFLFKTNRVLGIEICFLEENLLRVQACICEKTKSSIIVPFSKENFFSVEELLTALPQQGLPIAVLFTGKGIIHKKIGTTENESTATAFQRVFPTGNEQDFYTQVYSGLNGQGFASVIRKDRADDFIRRLESKGSKVIDFFIGPFSIENALALEEPRASVYSLAWAQHRVEVEDRKVREYAYDPAANTESDIHVKGLSLRPNIFAAFCVALHYFLPVAAITHSNHTVITTYHDYRNNRAFTRLLRTSAVSILAICLLNFLVFSHYFDKQKKLDNELVAYEGAMTTYDRLNTDFQRKNEFLQRSGLALGSKTSYFADRLLYDLPEDIQLTYLSVYPLKNRIEKDSVIEFNNKKVVAKGLCDKSIILNNWINLLKTKEFIADVVLDNFEQESERESGKFNLTIELK